MLLRLLWFFFCCCFKNFGYYTYVLLFVELKKFHFTHEYYIFSAIAGRQDFCLVVAVAADPLHSREKQTAANQTTVIFN